MCFKNATTASMAVLYTHHYCSRLRLCLSRGQENCAMAEIQLPHGTGLHATLAAANKTRKQRATPPKPSTINLCLFSQIYVASFYKHGYLHSTPPRQEMSSKKIWPSTAIKKKNQTPKQQKTQNYWGGGRKITLFII